MRSKLEECGETAKNQIPCDWLPRHPKILRRSAPPSILIFILYCTYIVFQILSMADYINNSYHTSQMYPIPTNLKPQVGKIINLGRKVVNCNTQKSFLQDSLNQQSVPNGIISQMKFTSSIHDHRLSNLCDDIMYDAGSRILDTMISYYVNRGTNLREAYYSNLTRIKTEISDMDYQEVVKLVDRKLLTKKLSCNKRHQVKLKRDAEHNRKYIPKAESQLHTTLKNVFKKKQRRRKSKNFHKPRRFSNSKYKRNKVKGTLPSLEDMTPAKLQDTVINLTDLQLSPEQLYIFYLSHSFAPTPPLPNLSRFQEDFDSWKNKLRYKYLFAQPHVTTGVKSNDVIQLEKCFTVRKSSKKAPISSSHALELFIENVAADTQAEKCKHKFKSPDNITNDCRKALNMLKNLYENEDIIIRPFDKGTGFFLLYREEYISRTLEHLSDTTKYKVVSNPKDAAIKIIEDITNWTQMFSDQKGMTTSVINNVIPTLDEQMPGKLYLNPKAHKPPPYPGRLITTGCNSYIEQLSALTAHELKKCTAPYVIVDSPDLLRKLDDLNSSEILTGKNILHVSVDVVNMFPNIPREFGITECTKHLNERPEPVLFSTECIVEGLKLTLDNNIANFNGTTYQQLQGTAMGPKNSCDYADLAMNFIDQAVHNNNPECSTNPYVPISWYRFRDDIYMPWVGTVDELMIFMDWLNSIHESLKFTVKYSTEGVEFLDFLIYSDSDDKIQTKLFAKSSDTHCYLIPTSCHKTHVVENIPYNTARRVFQNNSEIINYNNDKILYSKYLTDRGYNMKFVSDAFDKVEKLDRSSLYSKKPAEKKHKLCTPFVMDTNPALPQMSKIINRHKHILDLDNKLKHIIPSSSVFVSCRSAKTIKEHLISSKLPLPKPELSISSNASSSSNNEHDQVICNANNRLGCFKCSNKCYMCSHYLNECNKFTSPHTEQWFMHKSYLTCSSECIIYLIECVTHNVAYIGYTITNIKLRFSNNKSHFKKGNNSCEIIKHLNLVKHEIDFSSTANYDKSLSQHLRVTILEQVKVDTGDSRAEKEAKCEAREGFWQTQLRTLHTCGGLNKRDNRKYVSLRTQSQSNS